MREHGTATQAITRQRTWGLYWVPINETEKQQTCVREDRERYLNILLCDHLISFTYNLHLLLFAFWQAIEWKATKTVEWRENRNPVRRSGLLKCCVRATIYMRTLLKFECYRSGDGNSWIAPTVASLCFLLVASTPPPEHSMKKFVSPIKQMRVTEDFN